MRRLFAFLAAFALIGTATVTSAAHATEPVHHARAHFTATTDVGGHPRGKLVISQRGQSGVITETGTVRLGLPAGTKVVGVPYKDPACAPAVGVTAFPSAAVLVDKHGVARFKDVVVNPQSLNPAGTFSVTDTRSISVRQVVTNAAGQNVPNPVEEGCDGAPVVR